MATIRVLLFGPLAEQHGSSEEKVEVATDSTALDVVSQLGMTSWLNAGLRCALDGRFCELDSRIESADELALLPPVSGG